MAILYMEFPQCAMHQMQNFLGNIKRQLKPKPQGKFFVPPSQDIPQHLNFSRGDEDGFCLVGRTRSERSEAEGIGEPPPSYSYTLRQEDFQKMGSNHSHENDPLEKPPPYQNPVPNSANFQVTEVPPSPKITSQSHQSSVQTSQSQVTTAYGDVPFRLSPAFLDSAGRDGALPPIQPINWGAYHYDFSVEHTAMDTARLLVDESF
ncbi:hypothetical protein CAPTEDRAFT_224587 [Capitella teleta]|uniref:UMA domain-containing protein n=1 Tax=Capitella teleta TaxID=283909 RepID=R7VGL2_CAPTE|nr:hypothetical protein CAPTEDRAFT_224587 [Capitella teleta]|eukprot:ELU15456.1 hypothetical protein CAPTEDRAFT_224587 [Capitella teleta]